MPPEPHRDSRRITLVAAMAHDRVIGRDNALPWHLPADLAHFKRLTLDKPIVMGRRTWESLPGLLPRRRHVVITAQRDYRAEGCELASSPAAALALLRDQPEAMIVGGASIYAALLPAATHLALTFVDADIPGDTRFPAWEPAAWREVAREHRPADERNAYALEFVLFSRC
ncbi:dihydrofolate reductase [Thiohalocapsa sp. ML1]|jgi:dihydrofolate reductase|uniref:dihydrofolate reductase n=1 Tax=Thiohalocapsa sp. ML1 TaxID=1431688 RepID=UPI0007321091|nr:dihydrofolate reductase [Thiohalocapsa sp. ML1]